MKKKNHQDVVDRLIAEDVKSGNLFPISRYPDHDAMDISDLDPARSKWALIRPPMSWYRQEKGSFAIPRLGLFIVELEEDEQQRVLGLIEASWRAGGLSKFTFKYPLVALKHGELLDGWHRLALWSMAFGDDGDGPWTLVKVD